MLVGLAPTVHLTHVSRNVRDESLPFRQLKNKPVPNQSKILVVYYSKTGNTERVAKDVASRLGADIEEIVDRKKRGGIIGWIFGGRDAMRKSLTEIEIEKDPKNYDLVIVGTPTWAWNMTPAVRTYLQKVRDGLKNAAYFTTSGNTDPRKIVSYMEELSGKKAIAFTGFNEQELKNDEIYVEKLSVFTDALGKFKR